MKYPYILIASVLFFASGILFWLFSGNELAPFKDITKIIDYDQVNFAGEKMPLDGKNFSNREKFDRELLVLRFNFYQFILYHKRESIYFPYIEKKLKENNIPDDFKYLAVAESGLRNDVVSDAGAAGIWQFMPDTARGFGLVVNDQVDERYNFEKSTDAAILYFKKLHDDFHDWTLVAAAYNRGENGLRRAIDDQKVNSYYDLYLNPETSKYIFRILSIKYVMQNRNEIFGSRYLGDPFEQPKTKLVSVSEVKDVNAWARENGYNLAIVKQLNPWIKGNSIPSGNWTLTLLDLDK